MIQFSSRISSGFLYNSHPQIYTARVSTIIEGEIQFKMQIYGHSKWRCASMLLLKITWYWRFTYKCKIILRRRFFSPFRHFLLLRTHTVTARFSTNCDFTPPAYIYIKFPRFLSFGAGKDESSLKYFILLPFYSPVFLTMNKLEDITLREHNNERLVAWWGNNVSVILKGSARGKTLFIAVVLNPSRWFIISKSFREKIDFSNSLAQLLKANLSSVAWKGWFRGVWFD